MLIHFLVIAFLILALAILRIRFTFTSSIPQILPTSLVDKEEVSSIP